MALRKSAPCAVYCLTLKALRAALFENLVNQTVGDGLFRRHEIVAIGVFFNRGVVVPGVLDENVVNLLLDLVKLLHVNEDFFSCAFHASQRLMNHDAAVGQGKTLSFCSGGKQNRAHGSALTNAVRANVTGNELHRVVNRQPGGNGAARRVDVNMDVFLGSSACR